MTSRFTTTSPLLGPGALHILAVVCALLAGSILARDVSATPTSIATRPEVPTVCDSVGLIVSGTLPDPCYHLLAAWVERIEQLPWTGPIPSYAIRIGIFVMEPNPVVDIDCPAVLQPYERGLRVGRLPFGNYLVTASEYLAPFSPYTSAAPKDIRRSMCEPPPARPEWAAPCFRLGRTTPARERCDLEGPPALT